MVLELLFSRELFVRTEAGVLFFLHVLGGTIYPAIGLFLGEPAFMRLGWVRHLAREDGTHSQHGTVFLPLRRFIPRLLRGIPKERAVGPVYFVSDAREQGHALPIEFRHTGIIVQNCCRDATSGTLCKVSLLKDMNPHLAFWNPVYLCRMVQVPENGSETLKVREVIRVREAYHVVSNKIVMLGL